jgi:3-phosphoshikimate 1-carboxyvinyltransferase
VTDLVVHPQTAPLVGSVPVPSDKSIGHRALLFGALSEGETRIRGYAGGADNESTAGALRAMGVEISRASPTELVVRGAGLFALKEPSAPLDCGNSGTSMRLLCGILAAQKFRSTLVGDASLSARPMKRVVEPLRARGAVIEGSTRGSDLCAPLVIGPLEKPLGELEHALSVSSAQVKSALLLSGLWARGATRIREPSVSRDHTERLLLALGAPIRTVGPLVELDPAGWNGEMKGFDVELPGDLSAAAFLILAAQVVQQSRIDVRHVGTNPTRTGILEIARDMGAGVLVEPGGDSHGEPIGTLHLAPGDLRPARIGGEIVARAIDEIPVACALAARASGETAIMDAAELRVKESDRIAAMAAVLRAFGVECEEHPDGMTIRGKRGPLRACAVDSRGDHRIAMTSAVLALCADGPCTIRDCDNIATSFPKFVGTLRALGARIDVG